MKILITGHEGFVGKNLTVHLENKNHEVIGIGRSDSKEKLEKAICAADFIFHLAAANRPKNESEFKSVNSDFTAEIIKIHHERKCKSPLFFTSSTQASLENPYGSSKLDAESLLRDYAQSSGNAVLVARFPNIFGKWCKPNYNSVIATWCYALQNNEEIQVNSRETKLNLIYIDDVIKIMAESMEQPLKGYGEVTIPHIQNTTLGEIEDILRSFTTDLSTHTPKTSDKLVKDLYSTYCSYVNPKALTKKLVSHHDERGMFMETFREQDACQVSISTSKVGVARGSHYHHSKCEKFVVITGQAKVRLRKINDSQVVEYRLDAKNPEIITIPPGYTHDIANIGDVEMTLLIWANENFVAKGDDTHAEDVVL